MGAATWCRAWGAVLAVVTGGCGASPGGLALQNEHVSSRTTDAEGPVVLRRADAYAFQKFGIDLEVHAVDRATNRRAGLVHVETEFGHHQEFSDVESTFIYSVNEGSGVFMLGGSPHVVNTGDVLVVPPNTAIYYAGRLEMTLVTIPAWRAENERAIRLVDRSELVELAERYLRPGMAAP